MTGIWGCGDGNMRVLLWMIRVPGISDRRSCTLYIVWTWNNVTRPVHRWATRLQQCPVLFSLSALVQSFRYFGITIPSTDSWMNGRKEQECTEIMHALGPPSSTLKSRLRRDFSQQEAGAIRRISIYVLILHCLGIALCFCNKCSWPES